MLYTTKEVAEMFKISRETVLRMLRRGELEAIKLGKDYRFEEDVIQRFIRKRSAKRSDGA